MSVINQMLRDLEKRQQPAAAASQPQPHENSHSTRSPYLLMLLGVLLGMVLVLFWGRLQLLLPVLAPEPQTLAAEPTTVAVQAAAVTPPATEQVAAEQITASAAAVEDKPAAAVADDKLAAVEQASAAIVDDDSAAAVEQIDPVLLREAPSVAEAEAEAAAAALAEEQAWQALAATTAPTPARGTLNVTATRMSDRDLATRAGQLADQAYNQRRFDEALNHYREALARSPKRLDWRRRLAELQLASGDLTATGDTLAEGVRYQPDDNGLRLALAHVRQEQGQYAEALAILALVTPDETDAVRFYQLRGGLAQQLQQWPLALESYQQLLSRVPSDARYWLGLAIAHDGLQDYLRAGQAFGRALALEGLSATARSYAQQRLRQIEGQP